jgi:hypothetical protein
MRYLLILFSVTFALFGIDGEHVYKEKCASCHAGYIPVGLLKENFVEYNNTKLNLKAPTLNQLSFRLKQRIGDPNGDREMHLMEITDFVTGYLYHPDKAKSICMDEVIAAFDTMPSMKGKITEEEIEAVTEYIYDFDQKVHPPQKPRYTGFDEALKRAKREGKIIMIKATSPYCHYCKQMDREVLSDPEVVALLNEGFLPVEVNVYEGPLPMGLKYRFTPTLFFVDSSKKVLLKVPGALGKEDFIKLLKGFKQ